MQFAKNVDLGRCKIDGCTSDRILFSNCCAYHTKDLPENLKTMKKLQLSSAYGRFGKELVND